MPEITDLFGKASIDTDHSIATTVKTARTAGDSVLEAYDLSKFADDTPVFVVTYKKTTDPTTGDVSVSELVSWKALVNTGANTLTNLTVAPGYVDGGNDEGDFIECIPTSYWENSLIDGIFVGHNPDGTFKDTMPFTSLTANLLEGWIYDANTWVYVSGTGTTTGVFKIVGIDATSYLQEGMPFKIVQSGTTKYGFITKVAFSTDTTVTCFMAATSGTVDNSGIEDATITTPAFGKPKQPGFGFPLDPTKWTITFTSTSTAAIGGSYANTGSLLLSVPIGAWYIHGRASILVSRPVGTGAASGAAALSESTSAVSSGYEGTVGFTQGGASGVTGGGTGYSGGGSLLAIYRKFTTVTTVYIITVATGASAALITSYSANHYIKAICAYL